MGLVKTRRLAAMREAERISDNPFVSKYSTRESFVRSLEA